MPSTEGATLIVSAAGGGSATASAGTEHSDSVSVNASKALRLAGRLIGDTTRLTWIKMSQDWDGTDWDDDGDGADDAEADGHRGGNENAIAMCKCSTQGGALQNGHGQSAGSSASSSGRLSRSNKKRGARCGSVSPHALYASLLSCVI